MRFNLIKLKGNKKEINRLVSEGVLKEKFFEKVKQNFPLANIHLKEKNLKGTISFNSVEDLLNSEKIFKNFVFDFSENFQVKM